MKRTEAPIVSVQKKPEKTKRKSKSVDPNKGAKKPAIRSDSSGSEKAEEPSKK